MRLDSCHSNKSFEDASLLLKICGDALIQDVPKLRESNLFAAVYIDGRDRFINSYEDFASIKSFKLHSAANYPVFCFIANDSNFLDNNYNLISDWRINVIKIDPLNSLEEYTRFCIEKLYFLLPPEIKHIITIQPDAGLLKSGWEDYCLDINVPFLGARWCHNAGIAVKEGDKLYRFNDKLTQFSNGAFSYRDTDVMRKVSSKYSKMNLVELGRDDFRICMEDLFFGYLCYCVENYKIPTVKQCDEFSLDPITLEEYTRKDSFGFHYPKKVNEFSRFRIKQ